MLSDFFVPLSVNVLIVLDIVMPKMSMATDIGIICAFSDTGTNTIPSASN